MSFRILCIGYLAIRYLHIAYHKATHNEIMGPHMEFPGCYCIPISLTRIMHWKFVVRVETDVRRFTNAIKNKIKPMSKWRKNKWFCERAIVTPTVIEQNQARRLILKPFKAVIDFLMHNAGLKNFQSHFFFVGFISTLTKSRSIKLSCFPKNDSFIFRQFVEIATFLGATSIKFWSAFFTLDK